MKNCGIIFDCDGTLVNSLAQAVESFHFALEQVGEPRTTEQIKAHFGAGAHLILERVIGGNAKKTDLAFKIYLEHQTELAKETELHRGVRALLEEANSAAVPMAIVTGRHALDLEIVLAPHRLDHFFVTQIADNHVPNSKPAPDGILMAAQKMGLTPENTFYVGDSVYDVMAAKSAGSFAVAALWDDTAPRDELIRLAPDFLANTPADVWGFFKEHFANA